MSRTSPVRTPGDSFFDLLALTYDRRGLQALVYRPIHDAILARLGDATPSTIVDLGCGTGQLTRRLVERFPDATVVGVDLSEGMLSKAADHLGSSSTGSSWLLRADAQRLPLVPGSIDVVVCTESFHWYQDQSGALRGLADALEPGGRLLIASTAMITELGDAVVRRLSSFGNQPIRATPPARLRRLLARSGFETVHQRRIPRVGAAWPVLTDARRR